MEFEDLLKDVGDFGLYQILLIIIFLVPTSTIIPWVSMNAVFVSSTPEHWCYVPEVEALELSMEDMKRLIRPPKDPSCTRYDVNFTHIIQSGNLTVDTNWPVKKCDMGWQYDTTYYDETAVTNWNLVCGNDYYKGTIVSFVFVGVIIGTPLYGFLSDKYGRKKTFLSLALLVSVSELASAFCPYFTVFLVLRILIGSTMTSLYSLTYILILELVRADLRARINGITTNCWTVGMCLLALTAYLTRNWIHLTIVMSVATGCFLLFFRIIPESPSWLISQERYEEAAEVMGRISKMNKKKIQPEQLLENIQTLGRMKKKENMEKNSPLDFFKYPTMRKRFFLSTAVCIGVSIPYYGLQVNVTNLVGNEFFNFFLVSIVEIPAHLGTWWMLGNLGRKKSIEIGFAICAIACFVPTFCPEGIANYSNIEVVASILGKVGSSAAFMVMYQLGPELFPTSLRGVGMGLTSTLGTGSTLVVPYITQLEKHGSYLPFLVFGCSCVLAGMCAIFLPETLNTNLPQTVDDVEECGKNEKCFSCGWYEGSEYDLERKKSYCSNIVPAYSISKDIKELPAKNVFQNIND